MFSLLFPQHGAIGWLAGSSCPPPRIGLFDGGPVRGKKRGEGRESHSLTYSVRLRSSSESQATAKGLPRPANRIDYTLRVPPLPPFSLPQYHKSPQTTTSHHLLSDQQLTISVADPRIESSRLRRQRQLGNWLWLAAGWLAFRLGCLNEV